MADDGNCPIEQSLPGLHCHHESLAGLCCYHEQVSSWPSLLFLEARKLHKHLCLAGIPLNPFTLEKGVAPGWISLLMICVSD